MDSKHILVLFTLLALFSYVAIGQPTRGNGVDFKAFEIVNPSSPIFMSRLRQECDARFRTFDGSCTNDATRNNKVLGSTGRPQFSYFSDASTSPLSFEDLPSPRVISNALVSQSMDVRESRGLNELVTFIGGFIDHTVTATPTNDGSGGTVPEPFFIDVPEDDPMMANVTNGQLVLFRSQRGVVSSVRGTERPINLLTSAIDLDSVYGPSEERATALRSLEDGMMKTGPNNLIPLNTIGLSNAPNPSANFFVAGDTRSSEHPVFITIHTLFLREHNDIARELKDNFPEMDDEELFQNARQINIALFQKIVFKEWYPAITGRELPRYRGFRRSVDPSTSVLFATAAFRLGHTLVNNQVTKLGPGNTPLPPLDITETFFAGVNEILNDGVDPFLRGVLRTRVQEIDLMVVDALRNFLFLNVPGVSGIDLIALNLQRGRDHGLRSFVDIRREFLRGRASLVRSFADITSNLNTQTALQSVYGTVENVEAWIGMLAEDHAAGSSMGPTILAVWDAEFTRFRDGDRFYYENMDQYDPRVLESIPRLAAVFDGEDIMRAVLLRNTDITEAEMPRRTFFAN